MKQKRMAFKTRTLGLLASGLAASGPLLAAQPSSPLTLDSYLKEVRARHSGLHGSQASSDGAELRANEGDLITAPTVFANAQLSANQQRNLLFPINSLTTNTYSLGVSKTTDFGMSARLSYNLTYYNYNLSNPALAAGFGGGTSFYEGRPVLEVTQSLWRNFLGAETKAMKQQIEAGALARHYGESFAVKNILSGAEVAYWRLALARENSEQQQEALDRSRKMLEWNQRRARMSLADQTDLLQAQAGYDVRKLQLQSALDEQRAAARAFNQSRGVDADSVAERLEKLDVDRLNSLKIPDRGTLRDDVLAAQQQQRLTIAGAEAAINKDRPTFEVFGQLALNSRAPGLSDSFASSFGLNQNARAIGVRFAAPLNFGTVSDSIKGWQREKAGAELTFQRRYFDQEQDWKNLVESLAEAKKRLELSRQIELAQQKKLFHERDRLNRGRTTTYQVLMFEEDYSSAQLNRIRAQAQVLQIIAQMKTFTPATDASESAANTSSPASTGGL